MIRKFIKNKIFWGILFTLSIIVGIIYILYFTNLFILKEIKVFNTKRVDKNEIIKLTGLKGGEKLFRISMNKLKKRILTNNNIEDVTIVRRLPGTLEIKIEEREPLAILVKNNRGYLIDKNGVILSGILPEDYFFYPVVEIKNKTFEKKLFNFLVWLKNNKNYLPVYENLAKIILAEDKLILITKNHLTIYLPLISEKDWIYYYRNLDRIMAYLYEKKLIEKIELIRLDYPLGEALIKFRS
ncbi:cell division protein FtsQ/DivIB [Thermodesulfobacterium hydrogeniphilum]|uniref:cell division protein FtsQ/DivIB n=1 Tax=Thermodesulfobacterium hydrogeniphilum TaxID=161156 RepID=UPI00056DF390|nr:FtsQ-type POTRA domain-containing protein [Thermodesulfobacterium hydrogeniphilum]